MFSLKTKLASAAGAAGLMAAALSPTSAFAADVHVGDNGALSENLVDIRHEMNVDVNQSSNTNADINVSAVANTGGNVATGGSIVINTGDATNNVAVGVQGGSNQADLSGLMCGCEEDTNISIDDNGALSLNAVRVDMQHDVNVDQESNTDANIDVEATANTGGNVAEGGETFGLPSFHLGGHNYNNDSNHDWNKDWDHEWDKDWDNDHNWNMKYSFGGFGDHYRTLNRDYLSRYIFGSLFNSEAEISTGDSENNIIVDVRGGHNVL